MTPSLLPPPSVRNGRDKALSSGPSNRVPRAPNEKRARVTAKSFPEHQKLLIAATRVYYVKIWTFDAFPDDKCQAQWAVDSWDDVSDGLPLPDTSAIHYVSLTATYQTWLLPINDTGTTARSLVETQMQGLF